jgi:hypothetical protein
MLDGIPLLAVTILLIGIFIHIFTRLQLKTIRENWATMRCDPLVVIIGHLVPDGKDPNVDPTQFSIDNFNFCLTRLMDTSLEQSMNPAMNLLNTQTDAAAPIGESLNYLRSNATSLINPLTSMFQNFWNRIKAFVYQGVRGYRQLFSSFDRIFGVVVSSVFAGISMYKAIENLLNLVILVIIIIMTILVAMMVFAYFLLYPVMPIIMTTLRFLAQSVFRSAFTSLTDSFCVFPGTLVATPTGWRSVEDLIPGDKLGEGFVEGILKTSGKGAKCVSIGSVRLSESHLVYDIFDSKWKAAKDHTLASRISYEPDYLYCLNTSTRKWIVKGDPSDEAVLTLRDWEELEDDSHIDSDWERLISSMLNANSSVSYFPRISKPGRGLISSNTHVYKKEIGYLRICNIKVGDFVKDGYDHFTEVLGVYIDSSEVVPRSGPNSAAWVWNSDLGLWDHPEEVLSPSYEYNFLGCHLITRSGIFMLEDERFVRDFTEVGADRIHETYPFVKEFSIHW